jgi:hypothetical protein
LHDLGTLEGDFSSVGVAINDVGAVTGQSGNRAFLYTSGGSMVELNSLIDPLLGWTLQTGDGINDASQINGFGLIGGEQHAFLLTPVPEPAGVILASLGLLSLLAFCRRDYLRLSIAA